MQTLPRFLNRAGRMVGALALIAGLPTLPVATTLMTPTPAVAQATGGSDTIVLKSGKTVTGKILEETATELKVQIVVAGITSTVSYTKAEILSFSRGTGTTQPTLAVDPANAPKSINTKPANPGTSDKKKVYTIELTGEFGQDISQTPIRDAVKDAQKNDVDMIIVVIDNDWSQKQGGVKVDIEDDAGAFDQLFRAEPIAKIFIDEIPKEWTRQPEVIFWVKKAMGGAAFLPFSCKNIYFHSEGKMGGIGHLSSMFGSTGDLVVREKQFSLRLGHAEGMAIQGGYEPRLILAMARDEYVLSYKIEGGKPVYFNRMPQGPDEFLLTDDGDEQSGRADDIQALARGEGNDVLTINADLAFKLLVSKGTVDTMDDLVYKLGLSRNSDMVKGKSAQIMKGWRDGLESAKKQLRKLQNDLQEVAVAPPGEYPQRTQARGKRRSIAEQMQAIEKKYEEAINPRQLRVWDWNTLQILKERLKTEQLADKPEKR